MTKLEELRNIVSAVEVKEIKAALNRLFADTSVPPGKTRAELEEIKDEIDSLIDTLPPASDG